MRTHKKTLITFILLVGVLSACAHPVKPVSPPASEPQVEAVDPIKKAARSVVGIWDPVLYKASLTESYGNLKGPISIMAAGVVVKKENGSVVVLTSFLPNRPVNLEFIEDRDYMNVTIETLIHERTATFEKVNNYGRLLGAKTDKLPVSYYVNPVQIETHPLKFEGCKVFMVINYLGKPEMAIWGKIVNGRFVDETGLSRSFAVPGTPIFSMDGKLIGLITKSGRLMSVSH